MSQFQRGDLVRLKMTGDVFEIAELFATGMVKMISNPGLQLITSVECLEAVRRELDELSADQE